MSDRFADKYRIKSTRLPEWDYTFGEYFVTICAKDHEHYFGEISNGDMKLNELGNIVNEEIQNTSKIRENVMIEEYIIMPNHIHMVMFIGKNEKRRDALYASHKGNKNKGDGCKPSLQKKIQQKNNNAFGPQKNNLASIIRGIKGSITSRINKINKNFAWQPRYHEHIIRNEKELYIIREYIQNNPLSWDIRKNDSDLFP